MEISEDGIARNWKIGSSTLKLFDVPLNISTTFRCSRTGNAVQISFRVKGDKGKKNRST